MISRRAFLSGAAATAAYAACGAPPLAAQTPVRTGADRFIAGEWRGLAGKRVGIVTNQTGRLRDGTPLIDAAVRLPGLRVTALYGPEHGLRGTAVAGAHVASGRDERTGLPIYSLYGKNRRPAPAMLAHVDALIFDMQDVGARTYTYISTLATVMQAAGAAKKAVWVLDRPNPLGGLLVEGPVLEPAHASFIGLYPLPMRHGLTMGEVALYYREFCGIACDLHVVPMDGYERAMQWPDTGLPWVPTSPNIPRFRTALDYLATGPLGAAGLHNGVGSAAPFESVTAEGLDGLAIAAAVEARAVPGLHLESTTLVPTTGFLQSKRLTGVRVVVRDRRAFLPVRTALEILGAVQQLAPARFVGGAAFDRDWGTSTVREWTRANVPVKTMIERWRPRVEGFIERRDGILLYG